MTRAGPKYRRKCADIPIYSHCMPVVATLMHQRYFLLLFVFASNLSFSERSHFISVLTYEEQKKVGS